jgi:phosphoglycolate phosphatase
MIELTHNPLDAAGIVSAVQSPAAGAVVLFLGTTRVETGGRATASLDYECYPAMAERELAALESIGLGLSDTLEILMPGSEEPLQRRVLECYRRHWLGGWADRHALVTGAHEALLALERDGYWLAVATGKGRRGFERDVARFGLGELFLATRTVDEAPSKPCPDMILGLLDELGVRAEEALMVGDTPHDLRMAAAAGVAAVGVCSGSACRTELRSHEPAAVLPDVTHLAAWLGH